MQLASVFAFFHFSLCSFFYSKHDVLYAVVVVVDIAPVGGDVADDSIDFDVLVDGVGVVNDVILHQYFQYLVPALLNLTKKM